MSCSTLPGLLSAGRREGEHSTVPEPPQSSPPDVAERKKTPICREFLLSTPLSTPVESLARIGRENNCHGHGAALSSSRSPGPGCGKLGSADLIYTVAPRPHEGGARPAYLERALRETHVPAQRPPPEAQARLSRTHVDARRTDDPEAPPRQGAQAPLRLSARPAVERRYRLSRSKDFDAVYR